jgi:hypothetical protein
MWSISKIFRSLDARVRCDAVDSADWQPVPSPPSGLAQILSGVKADIDKKARDLARRTEQEALDGLRYVIEQIRKPENRHLLAETESLTIDLPGELSSDATIILDRAVGYLYWDPGKLCGQSTSTQVLFAAGNWWRMSRIHAEDLAPSLRAELESRPVRALFQMLSNRITRRENERRCEEDRLRRIGMDLCFRFIEAKLLQPENRQQLESQQALDLRFDPPVAANVCIGVEEKLDKLLEGTGMVPYVKPEGVSFVRGFKSSLVPYSHMV